LPSPAGELAPLWAIFGRLGRFAPGNGALLDA